MQLRIFQSSFYDSFLWAYLFLFRNPWQIFIREPCIECVDILIYKISLEFLKTSAGIRNTLNNTCISSVMEKEHFVTSCVYGTVNSMDVPFVKGFSSGCWLILISQPMINDKAEWSVKRGSSKDLRYEWGCGCLDAGELIFFQEYLSSL